MEKWKEGLVSGWIGHLINIGMIFVSDASIEEDVVNQSKPC